MWHTLIANNTTLLITSHVIYCKFLVRHEGSDFVTGAYKDVWGRNVGNDCIIVMTYIPGLCPNLLINSIVC